MGGEFEIVARFLNGNVEISQIAPEVNECGLAHTYPRMEVTAVYG
jgi:hypothetical protein